jgi:hypothetical protein
MVRYEEYKTLFKANDNFSSFYKRNSHLLEMTYYIYQELNEVQLNYLNFLSTAFNVRSPQGFKVPYMPFSWQVDFHANSLLVQRENVLNDFIMKSRGISFSYSALIEAIMVCIFYKGTTIPLMAHRKDTTNDLIAVGFWLVENANYDIRVNHDIKSEIQIIHKDGTISKIKPFPSGTKRAVDSVRSLRPVMAIIDEAGANPYFEDMLTAVEESIQTIEAKVLIGGTPKGTQHKFWTMHQNNLAGYNKYFLPAFNSHPTPENIQKLKPLVWWYNLEVLKRKITNDLDKFFQEYMCSPFNDQESLIPRAYYDDAVNKEVEVNTGIRVLAIDVASTGGHFAVATIWKFNKEFFKQEELWYWRNIELPDLEKNIRRIILKENPDLIRVDSKGLGLHLFQNLKRDFPNTEGLRGEMKVGNDKRLRQSLNEFMAHNFEQKMKEGKVSLLDDKNQEDHILNVNKRLELNSKQGHNDIFVTNCYAILPLNLKGSLDYEDIEKHGPVEEVQMKQFSIESEFRKKMIDSGFANKKFTYNSLKF